MLHQLNLGAPAPRNFALSFSVGPQPSSIYVAMTDGIQSVLGFRILSRSDKLLCFLLCPSNHSRILFVIPGIALIHDLVGHH